MDLNLAGKVAIVTGASQGIGRAIALRLAEEKVQVAVCYRHSKEQADELVSMNLEMGVRSAAYQCINQEPNSVNQMVEQVLSDFGKIDILINNAGVNHSALVLSMSELQWNKVISTNLNGTFYVTKAVLRSMLRQKSGVIIFIASTSAFDPQIGQAAYAASKAGIVAFSRSLALETAQKGIRVLCVAPGWVETDMTLNSISEEKRINITKSIPSGRFATPEEIADSVVFLSSPRASYILGNTVIIDGGEM